MNHAVLSMDVEDWRHLDYIDRRSADATYCMLDGVERYAELLERHGVRSTFFVLGELAESLKPVLRQLVDAGHEIASHGWDHTRPLKLAPQEFAADVRRSRQTIEDVIGKAVLGYRAPCFSLDRERLELLEATGHKYDSSRIDFAAHPLYGTIDMHGFCEADDMVFNRGSFVEFQVSTVRLRGRPAPVSGGGYLRIFPWFVMRRAVEHYLKTGAMYTLYIHPFELSSKANPPFPRNTRLRDRIRCTLGRAGTGRKLEELIGLLKSRSYETTTFAELRQRMFAGEGREAA
ncbi:MAG: polysaccharide deacetylase [Planctomycetaceae bacterium]|nr:polysaccharide deacetylase [Planctomycetaceae bacterium]